MKKFSILSYNVCFGFSGTDESSIKLYTAIEESNCDIICLQETHEGYEKELKKRFHSTHPYFIFHPPTSYLAAGCGVISKFPLRELKFCYPKIEGKKYKRVKGCIFRQQVVEVSIPNSKKLIISNFHLRPATGLGDDNIWKHIKSYLYETDKIRLNEFKYFWEFVTNNEETMNNPYRLFVGDFNEGKYGKTVKFLKSQKYKDAIQNKRTWFWPLKFGINATGSFDHIFYNEKCFKKSETKVFYKYKLVSDHVPVKTTLEFDEYD